METEIELKFFVSAEFAAILEQKVNDFKVLQHSRRQLTNVYFDTPDQWLREHNIGLRIRRTDDIFVQTVKTSGRVMAGLHQRPEYNASHDSLLPDLTKHPQEIWPEGRELEELSSQLVPLFETNFERTQWLISMEDGSQIELALDQGKVIIGDGNSATTLLNEEEKEKSREKNKDAEVFSPISEIELELKSGQTESLFRLARELSDQGGLRLGNLSKAARGYRLAQQAPLEPIKSFNFVPLKPEHTLEDAFVEAMEHALSHWHYHEQLYTEMDESKELDQINALIELKSAIGLIRQLFHNYADVLPRKATAILRQEFKWLEDELSWLKRAQHLYTLTEDKGIIMRRLDNRKDLVNELSLQQLNLPSRESVLTLFHSARYVAIVLDTSRWILSRGWQPFLDDSAKQKMTEEAHPFAKEQLDQHWQEFQSILLSKEIADPELYLEHQDLVRYRWYMELIFSRLFNNETNANFDLLWMDLLQGVDDLLSLEPLRNLLPELEPEAKEALERWLLRQQAATLNAMEQTRSYAMNQTPYWIGFS